MHVFWGWRQCKINKCLNVSVHEWVQLHLLLNGFPSQDQIYSMISLICHVIFGLLMTQLFQLVDNSDVFLKNTHTMFTNYNQFNWYMWSSVCIIKIFSECMEWKLMFLTWKEQSSRLWGCNLQLGIIVELSVCDRM